MLQDPRCTRTSHGIVDLGHISTFSNWTGSTYKDNVLALGGGEVDVALTTLPAGRRAFNL
jgi:hypothetical protein